jgi:hypothetical protein
VKRFEKAKDVPSMYASEEVRPHQVSFIARSIWRLSMCRGDGRVSDVEAGGLDDCVKKLAGSTDILIFGEDTTEAYDHGDL